MSEGQSSGIFVSWAALAIAAALIVSMVTGAIQLGAVQTHVLINTQRLETLIERERLLLVQVSRIGARQDMNEERIRAMEARTSR